MSILTDHISKKMNGVFLFTGQIAKLTPPWLLNLAKRHNQWKGTLKVGLGRTFFQPLIQILNQWVWLECVFTQIRTGYFLFGNVLKLKLRAYCRVIWKFPVLQSVLPSAQWPLEEKQSGSPRFYDSIKSNSEILRKNSMEKELSNWIYYTYYFTW
uniref:Uncharacterized protein n=1 Tax=Vitis vinifera TaxID=29760 RepID=F6HK05_VITVI